MALKSTTLKNGLRVVTDAMPRLKSAALGIWVNAGGRHESEKLQGVSHLLEHMAFKGTRTRNAKAIAEEIEAVGGSLNAYTAREQTAYHARVLKEDVELAIDLISDILQRSVFDETELKREKNVIIQEIGQAEDTPDDIIFDHWQAVAYPGQALGRAILGTRETVRSFSRQTLKSYMARSYGAKGMTLIACGAVDHDEIVELAKRYFTNLPEHAAPIYAPARYEGGEHRKLDDLEQAHFVLGLPSIALDDPDIFTAQVFAGVLGGGMSSRLFQEVREKRGLAYSIYAFSSHYKDSGLIGIYAGTAGKALKELVPVVIGEIEALTKGANEGELARAKAQFKAGLLMSLESPSARCEQIASQIFAFGRVLPLPELVRRIDSVRKHDLSRLGEKLLGARRPTVAALGPVSALEPYDRLAARFG